MKLKKLKIKFLEWSAGLPVAMLNKKTAEELGVHAKDRISIKTLSKKSRETSTIIDTVEDLIKENELAVSSELKNVLELKKGEKVFISLSPTPESLFHIKEKLNGKKLSKEDIFEIIHDVVNNSLSEAEIALFVSAMYSKGMTFDETVYLIKAILKYGEILKFNSKYIVDKHSIGGIPGNRTTPIVVAICAAAGLTVPKTSSRAITSPAGTADVIEAIAKIDFSIKDSKKILQKTGAFMLWGGSLGMVPADSKIIKIEKILKIDPEAQLLASVMSKKLAFGSKYLLIDIPYGKGAKVSKPKALRLKRKFLKLGKYFKINLKVVLTSGDQPIGNGIGPILELIDVIKILDPSKQGPKDLEKKSVELAGHLLEMTGKSKSGKGLEKAREILSSGKAFEKFKQIIKAQKGSLKNLHPAKNKKTFYAKTSGKISEIDNHKITSLARLTGCPIDKFSGIYLYVKKGDKLKKGDKILTIYSESKFRLFAAKHFYKKEKPVEIKYN
ncbi:thymidine phosphorylase [Candidatus Pacearchaeota archaeon]|nr:thymidine phosphorylase [Candidatus Pacearchaeota archaeon]